MRPSDAPRVLFATDLDRTLIYSRAAAGLGAEVGEEDVAARDPLHGAIGVEVYEDRMISYVGPGFPARLRQLQARCVVVPVTTRTRAQYERITLFDPPGPEWAVVANGGVVLHHGVPDEVWAEEVRIRMAATTSAGLDEVRAWLGVEAAGYIDHVRVADGFFAYTLVDRATMPGDAPGRLAAWLEDRGWRLSVQGRKLYAVPAAVSKSAAVTMLVERLDADVLVAAGDSLLDQDLLDVADVAIRPCHGELHDAGHVAHVVTTASGIAAADHIIDAVEAELRRSGPRDVT